MWRWLIPAAAVLIVLAVAGVNWPMLLQVSTWQRLDSPGPLSKVHAFIGKKCATCHAPVAGVTRNKCVACHANATELLELQPTAFHASIGECAPCHYEHQPGVGRPTRMDHAALARIGLAELAKGGTDAKGLRSKLANWMRKSSAHEQSNNLSPAESVLDCVSCHRVNDVHAGNFGQNCAVCHTTKSWFIADYIHPSPSNRQCAQCHTPSPCHFMEGCLVMMGHMAGGEGARLRQCYRCHKTTSWYDFKNPNDAHH